tara:strand:- start:870 stop:1568 length:699 start_codon:yes stop_codon:yes gene_type:complete
MPAQNFNKAHLREFRAARWVRALVALLVLGTLSWGGWEFQRRLDGQWTGPGDWWGIRATKSNYSEEALKWAEAFDLPYPYLMALIQLETGGRKPAGKRFESHVFDQLQAVRDGSRLSYENVTAAHLADASDEALRNLATSWGPFQLMGYKCILLEVQIRDIRGNEAIRFGVDWINQTYGSYLKREAFQDAFHLHNTGKPFPKNGKSQTYHPDYVARGLHLMNQYSSESLSDQ